MKRRYSRSGVPRKGTVIRTTEAGVVKFCRACREFKLLDQFQPRRNQCRCCTNARILRWKHERRAAA